MTCEKCGGDHDDMVNDAILGLFVRATNTIRDHCHGDKAKLAEAAKLARQCACRIEMYLEDEP